MKTHSEHDQVEDLIEGYALDALEPEERSLVDRHAAVCPPCREQLRVTADTAQMLGFLATPAAPPSYCKRKILEKIEREQFLHTPTRRTRPAAFSSWATVVALVLFMVTGVWGISLQRQLARVSNEVTELEEVLAEAQAMRPLRGEGQTRFVAANTFMKPGSHKAILIIRNLPPLSPGQTYQIWVVGDGVQEPLDTFNPPPADDTTQVVIASPEPMDHYKKIMVTIENASGTPSYPSQPVLFGDL